MIKDFTATLVEKKKLTSESEVWGFTFAMPEGEVLDFQAGQYLLLKVDGKYRQYSIASAPSMGLQGTFELIVEYFPGGLASTFLSALEKGGTAEFKGPAGVFVLRNTDTPKVFLVTGTGVAPVKSMIDTYLEQGGKATIYLLFGLKTRGHVYLYEHFMKLATGHPNFDFDICLSREESLDGLDEQHFAVGRVNSVHDVYLEETKTSHPDHDPRASDYYVCGGQEVVESLREYVAGLGVTKEHLFFEKFT